MKEKAREEMERRSRWLATFLFLAFFVLAGRLGYLQVVEGASWEEVAQGQRIRRVPIVAARGDILDRNGIVLATSRPSFTASLVYTGHPLSDEAVDLLSRILDIDPEVVREIEAAQEGRPYEPIPLKFDISPEEHTLLEEHRNELPGVAVEILPVRTYPGLPQYPQIGHRLAAHVLGYVKKGTEFQVEGADGLEAAYEGPGREAASEEALLLQGINGARQVEVDAAGRPIHILGEEPPRPGNSLRLTLDARLQAVAEVALAERIRYLREEYRGSSCPGGCPAPNGAAVAIDVRTGAILAMASVPGYDPEIFALGAHAVRGTDAWEQFLAEWERLNNPEDPGKPLINHALRDRASPGSTFKPITALAALTTGAVTPETTVFCPGHYPVAPGVVKRDWWAPGHGTVDLEKALARSCNIYFYEMGKRSGIEAIERVAAEFGLEGTSGIRDLEGEVAGRVAGPEAKRRAGYEDPWYLSETLDAAIGQGFHEFTPLQMAQMAAALANGGKRYRPYLVAEVIRPDGSVVRRTQPELLGTVQVDPAHLEAVRRGMLAVTEYHPGWRGVDAPVGTGYGAFQGFTERAAEVLGRPLRTAGKTGTAEQFGQISHGWYIGFAPFEEPEIAVAVFIRNGGGGSLAAAPVARAILDQYFGLQPVAEPPSGPERAIRRQPLLEIAPF